MVRAAGVVLATASLLFAVSATSAETPDPGPGYVTIQFGRTQWATGKNCVQLPNTVTIDQMAYSMATRGLVGTGGVVLDRTPETGLGCYHGYGLQAGWDWIHRMQEQRGWSFVSQSRTYPPMPSLPYDQQVAESCGTLPDFEAHDIHHADALFAFPGNRWSEEVQEDPVSHCFSYGRRYRAITPNVRSEMAAPWFEWTTSVSGGRCFNPELPCHTKTGTAGQTRAVYSNPALIASQMHAAPDTWYSVQFYRFVSGTFQNHTFGWDCRSPDWRDHWTSNGELYCWEDVQRILYAAALARGEGVVFAGPYDVALAWGRVPPFPSPSSSPSGSESPSPTESPTP
jgi:hypothetical protein